MKAKFYSHVQGLIQGSIWFIFAGTVSWVAVFPFYDVDGKISPLAATLFIAIASYFAGIFMCIGGIVSARKDYLNGKIKLEPKDTENISGLEEPKNPWIVAIREGAKQWPLFAVLAFGLCFGILPNGLPQKAFALFTAHVCLIHGTILVRRTCIKELLKFIAHPPKTAMPFKRYLWTEHLLGNGVANLIINFMFAYIVFHPGPKNPGPLVPSDFFVIDSIGMCAVIAIGVAIGAAVQSSTDLQAKRTLPPEGKFPKPNIVIRTAVFPAIAVMTPLLLKGFFMLTGIAAFSVLQAMTMKGVLGGGLAVIASGLAARWSAA